MSWIRWVIGATLAAGGVVSLVGGEPLVGIWLIALGVAFVPRNLLFLSRLVARPQSSQGESERLMLQLRTEAIFVLALSAALTLTGLAFLLGFIDADSPGVTGVLAMLSGAVFLLLAYRGLTASPEEVRQKLGAGENGDS